jgi:hypothetical protein
MSHARLACTLAAVFLLGACALEPLQPRRTAQPGVAGAPARPPAPARKEVVEKRDLSLLIARDGTICTVSEQVFRSTSVGDRVTCLWRRQG